MRFALATTALLGTVSAIDSLTDEQARVMQQRIDSRGSAKVVNRCAYDVYVWSIDKEQGCRAESATKLSTGETYREKFRYGSNGGISLKLSKFTTCGGKDISQLEYKIDTTQEFHGNFLDMSFVDCTGNLEDCPGRTDGFYMKAGNQTGVFTSSVNNEHCPVFSVNNAEEAAKVSYIKWDDPQTKYCDMSQNLELYLCGGEAPSEEDDESAPASSAAPSYSQIEISSAPEPTSTKKQKPAPVATSSTEEEFVVAAAAAVTEAPAAPPAPVIKTEVVYVTKYVDRRHEHARRHQRFHA